VSRQKTAALAKRVGVTLDLPAGMAKLTVPDCRWDLLVCDEAHKMSATYFGGNGQITP
jgi:hypothetical protein